MIRLHRIKIVGFKSPNRVIDFEFSPELTTVIYGQNGCGKTTFLRILHAIFSRNTKILREERVKNIELAYSIDDNNYTLTFEDDANDDGLWSEEQPLQDQTSSIFMGMYRGVFQSKFYAKTAFEKEEEFFTISKIIPAIGNIVSPQLVENKELMDGIKNFLIALYPDALFELNNKNPKHLFKDGTSIHSIEQDIIAQYRDFKKATAEATSNAFWLTFEQLFNDNKFDNAQLSAEDLHLLDKYKQEILEEIQENSDINKWESKLRQQVAIFLENPHNNNIQNNSQLNLLLKNIATEFSKQANINSNVIKLVDIFNDHLGQNKKLVVEFNTAFIQFDNGDRHELEHLSSGERNLLSLLALFLLQGQHTNFLLIDEPEISLNLKWQRKLIPLLLDINSSAQIIIASHSPAIAKNSNSLRELK